MLVLPDGKPDATSPSPQRIALRCDIPQGVPPPIMYLPPFCRRSEGPVSDTARAAWRRASENYLAPCAREANWNKLIEIPAMREMLGDSGGKTTLEVGCGPAHYSVRLATHGAEVHGLDPVPRLLEAAAQNAAEAGVELHLREGGVERLNEYPEEHFDIVLFPMMLEYVDDLAEAFGQARRILKPSGFVAISVVHPMRSFSDRHEIDGAELAVVGHYLEAGIIEWAEWIMKDDNGDPIWCKSHRRTIEQYVMPLVEAGLAIDQLREPDATPGAEELNAKIVASNRHCPQFLLMKARKRGG